MAAFADHIEDASSSPVILVKFEMDSSELLIPFEDKDLFLPYYNATTLADETADGNYTEGSSAVSFAKLAGAVHAWIGKSGLKYDFSSSSTIVKVTFDIKIKDSTELAKLANIDFSLFSGPGNADFRTFSQAATNFVVGWNEVTILLSDTYVDTGSPDLEDITHILVGVTTNNASDTLTKVICDNMLYYPYVNETFQYSTINIVGTINDEFWEGALLSAGTLNRGLSERRGLYNIGGTEIVLSNDDLAISELYHNVGEAQGIKNRTVTVYLGFFDVKYSNFLTVYQGIIDDLNYDRMTAKFTIRDNSKKYFDRSPRIFLDPDEWTTIGNSNRFTPASIIYGIVENDTGPLPTIFVGEHTSGFHWYVVAGHACKDATCTVYADAATPPPGTYSVDYEYTLGDNIYTVLKVTDDSGNPWDGKTITVSISGRTDDLTMSGTVLDDPVDCIEDYLTNILEIPTSLIDSTLFATTKVLTGKRNQIMAGAITQDAKDEDILRDMCVSHNLDFYLTRAGKFALNTFTPEITDDTVTLYTDEIDILKNTFSVLTGVKNIVNRIRFRLDYDYVEAKWMYEDNVQSSVSISKADATYDWPSGYLNFYWVRAPAVAKSVARRQLFKYRNGRPRATFDAPIEMFQKDLTDKVRITHYEPPSREEERGTDDGWKEHLCRIRELRPDLDRMRVTVVVDNMADLAQGCAYLGNRDTFSTDWLTASSDEQEYLYLCDRISGKFSNGDSGKSLC